MATPYYARTDSYRNSKSYRWHERRSRKARKEAERQATKAEWAHLGSVHSFLLTCALAVALGQLPQ